MASRTDLINAALNQLGASSVTSLADNSDSARLMTSLYPPAFSWLLRAYPWNCTIKRSQLAETLEAPVWGYEHTYALPPECLRLLEISDETRPSARSTRQDKLRWNVEGRFVATNIAPCYARYTSSATTETNLDPHVQHVLINKLASDAAYAVTQSNTVQTNRYEILQDTIKEARTTDALEGTRKPLTMTRLQQVRN